MADIKEFGNKIVASLGSLVFGGAAIAIIVWVGAEIYFEFQHLKREKDRVEIEYKSEIIRLEGRLDKITSRNKEASEIRDKELSIRVTTLELPNSDK